MYNIYVIQFAVCSAFRTISKASVIATNLFEQKLIFSPFFRGVKCILEKRF